MIVDSIQKRTGGLRTANKTPRISRPSPIVTHGFLGVWEGAGNV
jgi:hypothetical protein